MSARSNVIPFGKRKQQPTSELTSEHREYIAARGIDLKTAERAGLYSRNGHLRFPYFELDGSKSGFTRTRRFSGPNKFTQKKGTKPRFYYPKVQGLRWTQIAKDAKTDLYLCEGETRSLAIGQHGEAALSIGGKDNWLYKENGKSRPLPDFDSIEWKGRRVVLVFDADLLAKIDVQRALRQLAAHLRRLGADVFVKEIPDLGDGKTAADDYIASEGMKGFRKLKERAADDPRYDKWGLNKEPENTDVGNAQRFVADHGDTARFVHGLGWFMWDGNHWQPDEKKSVTNLAIATVKSMFADALDLPDRDKAQKLTKHAFASESRERIKAMIELATTRNPISTAASELDRDALMLGVRNGVLDLRAMQRIDARAGDLITKQAGCDFDAEAECPRWEQFVLEVMGGDEEMVAFLQRMAGYALTGDTREQCLFFLFGGGANGKTTFVKVLKWLLGDYALTAQPNTFMQQDSSGSAATPDIARLRGARLVLTVETEQGKRLAESLIKQLTGQDTITARQLHKDPFEFEPQFKIVMAGNHRPVIRGSDDGIWRRIRLVPFEVVFPPDKQDKSLDEVLRAELPGILNWALEGCREWQKHGLQAPKKVLNATAKYRSSSDILELFFSECCRRDEDARVDALELYEEYGKWAIRAGHHPLARNNFTTQLEERGFKVRRVKKNGRPRRIYFGIELREGNQ